MAYYRLYLMDGESTHILERVEFEARDDAAAIASCELRQPRGPMELWHRDRRIRSWSRPPPSGDAAPSLR